MPTPFPGMDPYLERPGLWEEVHTGLIAEIQQFLAPLVRPRYRVAVERRTYLAVLSSNDLVGKPDVLVVSPAREPGQAAPAHASVTVAPQVAELPMAEEVIERYLEIRAVTTGEVITVIEILSHSNKSSRQGREQYERKRLVVLASLTNLVEIDLLRAGDPMPMRVADTSTLGDYRLVVSRSQHRPRADVYLFGVRDPIPAVPIPLRPGEAEPMLALNQIVHNLYDQAGYDLAMDYSQPPVPPLAGEDAQWAAQCVQQHTPTTQEQK
jgi:Protein of unknown function (DUF4058)